MLQGSNPILQGGANPYLQNSNRMPLQGSSVNPRTSRITGPLRVAKAAPRATITPMTKVATAGQGFDAYKYADDDTVFRTEDNYGFRSADEFLKAGGNWGKVRTIARPASINLPSGNFQVDPGTGQATQSDQISAGLNVEPADVFSVDDFRAGANGPTTASAITDFLASIQSERQKLRESLVGFQQPTDEEISIEEALTNLRKDADLLQINTRAGTQEMQRQAIPQKLIEGQQGALLDQSNNNLQTLAVQEKALLERLGLAERRREGQYKAKELELSFLKEDSDLFLRAVKQISQEEQRVFERAMALDENAQGILGTILDKFEGLDMEDLDPATQGQIASLASQAGVPLNILAQGMKVVKDQILFDNQMKMMQQMGSGKRDTSVQEIGGKKVLIDNQTGEVIQELGMAGDLSSDPITTPSGDVFIPKAALTAAQRTQLDNALKGESVLKRAEELYRQAIGGEYAGPGSGAASRLKGLFRWGQKVTGVGGGQAWTQYNDFIGANMALIARGIKGEVGTLTDQDIARAKKAFPGMYSSPSEAATAFTTLKGQIQDLKNLYGTSLRDLDPDFSSVGADTKQGSTPYLKTLGTITGIDGSKYWKWGLDVDLKKGDPVKAPISGKVLAAGKNGGFGLQVKIAGDDGREWWLSHFDNIMVKPGQRIKAGQTIALGGNTGKTYSTSKGDGSHLDITVKQNGKYIAARQVKSLLDKLYV